MQCPLWARVNFVLGYSPSPPFVTLSCCFLGGSWLAVRSRSCVILLQSPILLRRSSPFHLSYQSIIMFRDPELRQLAQALPYILVHDRAASTVSTYLGAYKSWKAWALRHNASVLPADFSCCMVGLGMATSCGWEIRDFHFPRWAANQGYKVLSTWSRLVLISQSLAIVPPESVTKRPYNVNVSSWDLTKRGCGAMQAFYLLLEIRSSSLISPSAILVFLGPNMGQKWYNS